MANTKLPKTLSIDKDVLDRVLLDAEKENRSPSNFVETALVFLFMELDHERLVQGKADLAVGDLLNERYPDWRKTFPLE